jgi:taspase (threonine aspartase 1)
MLARKIYDKSNMPLGMSRVPPNFLAGEGAKDFAWEHGMILMPDESMISPIALERYKSWAAEVDDYDRDHDSEKTVDHWCRRPLTPIDDRIERLERLDRAENPEIHHPSNSNSHEPTPEEELKMLKNHSSLAGGKGRPASSPNQQAKKKAKFETSHRPVQPVSPMGPFPDGSSEADNQKQQDDVITDTVGAIAIDRYGNIAAGSSSGGIGMKHPGRVGPAALIGIGTHVVPEDPTDPESNSCAVVTSGTGELIAATLAASTCAQRMYYSQKMGSNGSFTHVLEEEALRSWMRKEFISAFSFSVLLLLEPNEDCFCLLDHTAVAHSVLFGAIGVVIVKKNNFGMELYFAHNTDSFVSHHPYKIELDIDHTWQALASMSSNADKPSCLMSRGARGTIAQGGCRIKFTNPCKLHDSVWQARK